MAKPGNPADLHYVVKQAITPGQILYIYCPHINPAKQKYIILLSVEPRIRYVFINSDKSAFTLTGPQMDYSQVEIKKADYPDSGLTKTVSYIDCSAIKSNLSYEGLALELQDVNNIKGIINDQTKREILIGIKNDCVPNKVYEEIKNSLK